MTASEFNAQKLVKAKGAPLPTTGAAWTGFEGDFSLVTTLGERLFEFPISPSNGGVQVTGWRGLEGTYGEPRINAISFVIDPQETTFQQAWETASGYCGQVIQAGLRIDMRSAPKERPLKSTKEEAMASMNGVSACSIRNEVEGFEALVVPHDHGNQDTKFRIEMSISDYFEIE